MNYLLTKNAFSDDRNSEPSLVFALDFLSQSSRSLAQQFQVSSLGTGPGVCRNTKREQSVVLLLQPL